MGLKKKIEKCNKRLEEYDRYTKNRKNRPTLKHEEAIYIGITASLLVAIIFTIFEALEIFLSDAFGMVGYPAIGIKILLALILFVAYTHYLQRLMFKRDKKHKK